MAMTTGEMHCVVCLGDSVLLASELGLDVRVNDERHHVSRTFVCETCGARHFTLSTRGAVLLVGVEPDDAR